MGSMIFAYGTLMPRDPESAAREGWEPDAVRGRLYDLGPFPALVDLDDPESGWVDGYLRRDVPAEMVQRLDAYEGIDRGPYRRVRTITRNNNLVWVYVHDQPLPPDARGPLTCWDGSRRVRFFRSLDSSPGEA
jgi:gamma-glutamylcyclotransferase (GGCT)/AIG2-like uncharacterized protein YtfP